MLDQKTRGLSRGLQTNHMYPQLPLLLECRIVRVMPSWVICPRGNLLKFPLARGKKNLKILLGFPKEISRSSFTMEFTIEKKTFTPKKKVLLGLPWWSSGEDCFHCRGCEFNPWPRGMAKKKKNYHVCIADGNIKNTFS